MAVQYQQEIALLQEKLRLAALRQEECEARLMVQDQQNQRMLQEYQVWVLPETLRGLLTLYRWTNVMLWVSDAAGGHREPTEETTG